MTAVPPSTSGTTTDSINSTSSDTTSARGTAGERAYEWTRDAILDGRFPEGSFLEEKIVCEQAGVSRTPVREAFQRLASEHYLDLVPRRGAQVRPVTALELVETYEMRCVLEGHGFELICAKRNPVPDAISNVLDTMEDPEFVDRIRRGDRVAINRNAKLDFQFHAMLIHTAGNALLEQLFLSLRPRQQRIAVSAVSHRPSRLDVIGPQHRRIFEALQAFDRDAAIATLREHLQPDAAVVGRLASNLTIAT